MKSSYLMWLVIAGVVLAGGYYYMKMTSGGYKPPVLTASPTPALPTTVQLTEQNKLGQSGTVTIMDNAQGKAVVKIAVSGGKFPDPQPAHIHIGSCPKPGAVKYPLTSVVNGVSETTLAVSVADLKASTELLAVNLHQSAAKSSVYTACGDLSTSASTTAPKQGGSVTY